MVKPSLGCDPEIFVKSKAKLLPAFDFLPSKDAGLKVGHPDVELNSGELYWDGFQAEWKLSRGWTCLNFMIMLQQNFLKELLKQARARDNSAKLSLDSVVKIPTKLMNSLLDGYVELGCMPSYNAYGEERLYVGDPRALLYRFAGGHVHLEVGEKRDNKWYEDLVKTFDAILGIWAVGAAASFDSPVRRQYYGKAGEHRRPKYALNRYGIEYRTLSNFWICSPFVMRMVFELARKVLMDVRYGEKIYWNPIGDEVKAIINEGDVVAARKILKANKSFFSFIGKSSGDRLFKTGMHGIESVLKTPEDIESNWKLTDGGLWSYDMVDTTIQLRANLKNERFHIA